MADQPILGGTVRTEFGKGAARRARREGNVPAVVYGKGQPTEHIMLDEHEVFLVVKDNPRATVTLKIDGNTKNVKIQAIARHPVTRDIEHVDFLILD